MKTFRYVEGLPELKSLPTEQVDGKRYYVTPNGNRLPSVTTVLGHFKKASITEWRNRVGHEEAQKISTRASTRGTKFHNLLEKYLSNQYHNNREMLFENIMPDMKQAFHDAEIALDKIDNIHYIETPLWSERLGLAGRTDVIGEYDGVLSIIDFKTSLKEKKEEWIDNYFEQGTAYALMYKERVGIAIQQVVIIISVDGLTEPQVFIKPTIDYVDSLINKIWLYKKEHTHVC
jgi:genome maintenance exonuclease 1